MSRLSGGISMLWHPVHSARAQATASIEINLERFRFIVGTASRFPVACCQNPFRCFGQTVHHLRSAWLDAGLFRFGSIPGPHEDALLYARVPPAFEVDQLVAH